MQLLQILHRDNYQRFFSFVVFSNDVNLGNDSSDTVWKPSYYLGSKGQSYELVSL